MAGIAHMQDGTVVRRQNKRAESNERQQEEKDAPGPPRKTFWLTSRGKEKKKKKKKDLPTWDSSLKVESLLAVAASICSFVYLTWVDPSFRKMGERSAWLMTTRSDPSQN